VVSAAGEDSRLIAVTCLRRAMVTSRRCRVALSA
jgi:hypothetical protein